MQEQDTSSGESITIKRSHLSSARKGENPVGGEATLERLRDHLDKGGRVFEEDDLTGQRRPVSRDELGHPEKIEGEK